MGLTEEQKRASLDVFNSVQANLTAELESIDGQTSFKRNTWSRGENAGGGTMAVMRGQRVEKSGVNVSEVYGDSYPAIESEHSGKPFYAAGISTVTHMFNPKAPIGHMNVRVISVGDTFWIGGGGDLTPFLPYEEDTNFFHDELKQACEIWSADAYDKFSKWCDEYFYIKHRKSVRGVGGVFYDYLTGDFDKCLNFQKAISGAFVKAYTTILERRVDESFTDEDKEGQLHWRGRYAEFNMIYDRGTKFGLMTGGDPDAIFVSLPPVVKW